MKKPIAIMVGGTGQFGITLSKRLLKEKFKVIIREKNGLAMSSRNKYLTEHEYSVAATIFKALVSGKTLLKNGELNCEKLKNKITKIINSEPQFKIDYVSVANRNTLEEIKGKLGGEILVSVAALLGQTRLIDNFTYSLSDLHNC